MASRRISIEPRSADEPSADVTTRSGVTSVLAPGSDPSQTPERGADRAPRSSGGANSRLAGVGAASVVATTAIYVAVVHPLSDADWSQSRWRMAVGVAVISGLAVGLLTVVAAALPGRPTLRRWLAVGGLCPLVAGGLALVVQAEHHSQAKAARIFRAQFPRVAGEQPIQPYIRSRTGAVVVMCAPVGGPDVFCLEIDTTGDGSLLGGYKLLAPGDNRLLAREVGRPFDCYGTTELCGRAARALTPLSRHTRRRVRGAVRCTTARRLRPPSIRRTSLSCRRSTGSSQTTP